VAHARHRTECDGATLSSYRAPQDVPSRKLRHCDSRSRRLPSRARAVRP
jgi:hypothetical protein